MLSIFIALSSTIVDSGFGGSLVYYKDVTKKDYSTVFWINILISVSLYSLIYIFADEISEFYETPILTKLVKILGLTIIFNSLGVVQFTILYKNLKFKKNCVCVNNNIYFICDYNNNSCLLWVWCMGANLPTSFIQCFKDLYFVLFK